MTRSLARQFLVWQLAVVVLLLAAVAGFAAVRSDAEFRDTQGRRMLSVAEDVAALDVVRQSLAVGHYDPLPGVAVGARNISGADDVLIVDVARDRAHGRRSGAGGHAVRRRGVDGGGRPGVGR